MKTFFGGLHLEQAESYWQWTKKNIQIEIQRWSNNLCYYIACCSLSESKGPQGIYARLAGVQRGKKKKIWIHKWLHYQHPIVTCTPGLSFWSLLGSLLVSWASLTLTSPPKIFKPTMAHIQLVHQCFDNSLKYVCVKKNVFGVIF